MNKPEYCVTFACDNCGFGIEVIQQPGVAVGINAEDMECPHCNVPALVKADGFRIRRLVDRILEHYYFAPGSSEEWRREVIEYYSSDVDLSEDGRFVFAKGQRDYRVN